MIAQTLRVMPYRGSVPLIYIIDGKKSNGYMHIFCNGIILDKLPGSINPKSSAPYFVSVDSITSAQRFEKVIQIKFELGLKLSKFNEGGSYDGVNFSLDESDYLKNYALSFKIGKSKSISNVGENLDRYLSDLVEITHSKATTTAKYNAGIEFLTNAIVAVETLY